MLSVNHSLAKARPTMRCIRLVAERSEANKWHLALRM